MEFFYCILILLGIAKQYVGDDSSYHQDTLYLEKLMRIPFEVQRIQVVIIKHQVGNSLKLHRLKAFFVINA